MTGIKVFGPRNKHSKLDTKVFLKVVSAINFSFFFFFFFSTDLRENKSEWPQKFHRNFCEKISTAILPLPLIQEEQLSITGKRNYTKYW